MAPTLKQAQCIASLKMGRPGQFTIPIRLADASVAGHLVPITHRLAEDASVVDSLFRWRRDHMTAFLTVFVPTPEKTRAYLTAFSLPDAARILFLLADRAGRFVGHIGLCNIAADGAEIDNVIRGEFADIPEFMVFAHLALLRWAFSALDIPRAYLNVLANNTRAIRTYEKVGMIHACRSPLMRQGTDDNYRLVPATPLPGEATGPVLVKMELQRDSFYRGQSQ